MREPADSASLQRLGIGPEVTGRLHGAKVLVIGDLMLDAYLMGDAERISPEAPVPVVRITGERHLLGGAGNVARNIAALGGVPTLVGTVGVDREADVVNSLLEEEGISPSLLSLPGRPTTVKTRVLSQRQQMLRLDREDAAPLSAAERAELFVHVEKGIDEHQVIILSDYNKGLVSKLFMDEFRRRLEGMAKPPLVLIDPKPGNVGLYQKAFLLTPNTRETGECANLPVRTPHEILEAGKSIMERIECSHLLTTLGADGMALFVKPDEVWHIPTMARDVFDVTGAGDTVIATLGLCLAAGLELLPSAILANYAAGLVVAQVGAATAAPEQLAEALRELPAPCLTRWI